MTKLLMPVAALILFMFAQGTGFAAPIVFFGTHYEENKSLVCPNNGNGCRLVFTAVPTGKALQIKHLSCKIFEEQRRVVHVLLAQLAAGNTLIRRQYFVPVFVSGGTPPGIQRYAVSGPADFVLGPGGIPVVDLSADLSTDSSFECQIVGKFVTANTVE